MSISIRKGSKNRINGLKKAELFEKRANISVF